MGSTGVLLSCLSTAAGQGAAKSANVLQARSVRVNETKTSKGLLTPPQAPIRRRAVRCPWTELHVDCAGVQATAVAGLKVLALRPAAQATKPPVFSSEQGPRTPPCRNASAVNS